MKRQDNPAVFARRGQLHEAASEALNGLWVPDPNVYGGWTLDTDAAAETVIGLAMEALVHELATLPDLSVGAVSRIGLLERLRAYSTTPARGELHTTARAALEPVLLAAMRDAWRFTHEPSPEEARLYALRFDAAIGGGYGSPKASGTVEASRAPEPPCDRYDHAGGYCIEGAECTCNPEGS